MNTVPSDALLILPALDQAFINQRGPVSTRPFINPIPLMAFCAFVLGKGSVGFTVSRSIVACQSLTDFIATSRCLSLGELCLMAESGQKKTKR